MKTFLYIFLLVLVVSLLVKCDDDDTFPKPPYPTVATLEASDISASGVTLNGSILTLTNEPITDHGFAYGFSDFGTAYTFKTSLGTTEAAGPFHAAIAGGLFSDTTYFVKAYLTTKTYTIYGPIISFQSQGGPGPSIESFSPLEGAAGDTVVIKGNYFSPVSRYDAVKFGPYPSIVVRADGNTIVCIVPKNIPDSTVPIIVTVAKQTTQSKTSFQLN